MSGSKDSTPEDEPKKRTTERVEVELEVGLRKSGYQKSTADLLDISSTGCRVELREGVGVGEAVFVTVPGLESIPAKIVWVKDWIAGIEFEQPIHPSVFEFKLAHLRR